jgi:SAM-dependent methyltransferase
MHQCLQCHQTFESSELRCPACGQVPAQILGYPAYAPALAYQNDGMPAGAHHTLDDLQEKSFWFRERNVLIVQLLRRHFPAARHLLEVGCGTGFVLAHVQRTFPAIRLCGSEIYSEALPYAHDRLGDAVTLLQMDARAIPFEKEFDVICALDVLEHIEDDESAISAMRKALVPGGGLLISVPQHPFLWSAADAYAHHKRRYRRKELLQKLCRQELEVVAMTSFMTSLLPIMTLQRLFAARRKNYRAEGELVLPRLLDRVFGFILAAECRLISAGLSLPAGGSLFAVARRAETP